MSARAEDVLEERGGGRCTMRYERHYDHPVERVWAALTETAELIASWGDADVELLEDGKFVPETDAGTHGVLRWELRPEAGGTKLTFSSTLAD